MKYSFSFATGDIRHPAAGDDGGDGARDDSPARSSFDMLPSPSLPTPLCDHSVESLCVDGYRAICRDCNSYWDLESLNATVPYDETYPEMRGHFDPRVGALKVRTLRHWLAKGSVDLTGKTICEVGFGGGTCLPFLAERAAHVIGLEVNQAAIDRVRATGVRAELLRVDPLPALPRQIDVWLFQDSFEHIPDPSAFVAWMNAYSTPTAEILVVLPRGDSLSRRLMGRLWPHKLPDHQFQWSKAGLREFLAKRGWHVREDFFALKYVSPQMLVAHALHHAGAAPSIRKWLGGAALVLPFNFGEMALVLRRAA